MKLISEIIDLKMSFLYGLFVALTFSEAENVLKIIAGILLIGYQIDKWYLMRKNNKKNH